MPITKESLDEKLTNARAQREQLVGQLNQITGVILILEQLQREEVEARTKLDEEIAQRAFPS